MKAKFRIKQKCIIGLMIYEEGQEIEFDKEEGIKRKGLMTYIGEIIPISYYRDKQMAPENYKRKRRKKNDIISGPEEIS